MLEESIINQEEDKSVRKKFNNILVESLQNMGHHSKQLGNTSNSDLILVVSKKGFYKIITGNLIENINVPDLEKSLVEINSMDPDELRAYYKKVMANETFSDKGTAGLGFIDMARKTGQKLEYQFYKMDDKYSYFAFQVKVDKKNDKTKPRMTVVKSDDES